MSNEIVKDANKNIEKVFMYGEADVRTVEIDGNPWFVGKDVAKILGYKETAKAIREHVDKDDRMVSELDTIQGYRDTVIINESGVYSLIFSSKLAGAKRFKKWVTSEVLPQIRKTGMYVPEEIAKRLDGVVNSVNGIMDSIGGIEKRLAALEEKQEKPLNKEWFSSGAQQVRLWAKERLEFDYKNNNLKTPSHELYADYILWCSEKIPDYEPLGVRAFTSSVKKLFPVREMRSFHGFPQPTWVFLNVRLKNGNPLLTD